jgi:hypothetical protein
MQEPRCRQCEAPMLWSAASSSPMSRPMHADVGRRSGHFNAVRAGVRSGHAIYRTAMQRRRSKFKTSVCCRQRSRTPRLGLFRAVRLHRHLVVSARAGLRVLSFGYARRPGCGLESGARRVARRGNRSAASPTVWDRGRTRLRHRTRHRSFPATRARAGGRSGTARAGELIQARRRSRQVYRPVQEAPDQYQPK